MNMMEIHENARRLYQAHGDKAELDGASPHRAWHICTPCCADGGPPEGGQSIATWCKNAGEGTFAAGSEARSRYPARQE